MNSTHIQQLAQLRDKTGILFPLRPHVTIDSLTISDATVMMGLTVHRYTETVSRVTLTARGFRMLIWNKDAVGRWQIKTDRTMWDDDFEPVSIHQVGRIETPAEYHARRDWEAMQYRVGTAKSPMDSAERASDPKDPMHDYWMKG